MVPSEEDVKYKLYLQDIPSYLSDDNSASISLGSAIALVNRYCSLLPQDKFTQLYPLWVLEGNPSPRASPSRNHTSSMQPIQCNKLAYLQLPINAPIRNIFKGIPMPNKRYAKRAVALIACVILHRKGELGKNDLLPVIHEPEALDDNNLFPNWIAEKNVGGVPGSKRLKRVYQKEVPKVLSCSHPKPGIPTYVYHIIETTVYNPPSPKDSRGKALYHVFNMNRGFAILSSRKLPQVCDFSIFMSSGEIDVKIEPEHEKEEVVLTDKEIEELELFHTMLFLDLLNICKQFLVVDKSDSSNSYLIAPTCKDSDGKWIIDWEIVRNFPVLPQVLEPPPEEKANLKVDDENFLYEVVTPWYRGSYIERHYIVTQVCKDMSSRSPFPSLSFPSFESYFKAKYELTLTHPSKPLLEVKAISSRIDCTHPKNIAEPFDDTPPLIPLSKRQMQLKNGDFLEHLIAELVTKRHFPSTLWLKATTLPTILHRFTSMQLACELRSQICHESNITNVGPPKGKWRRLEVEANDMPECESKPVPSNFFNDTVVNTVFQDPPDLEHDIDSLCLLDIVQYHKIEIHQNESQVVHHCDWRPIEPASVPENVLNRLQGMAVTDDGCCQGPELADTLSALTGASAGDVISLERLETLGDSFLKFAVSTFLYLKYPKMDEGKLTTLKGKMISNRNLYYCGKKKLLGGKMKVHSFAPQSDWTPPGFVVPPFLKEKLNSHSGITKSILFQLIIPEIERRSGQLSRETMIDIVEALNESQTNNVVGSTSTTLEALLGTQTVPDKSVADSVEAMIGAWLISGGCSAALRLLGWFGVFPHGRDGPAGTWEDLVGAEALDMGKQGMIKDQTDYDIIGGVVDWGPNALKNIALSQVSEGIADISLFRLRKESDTVIEKGKKKDKSSEGLICVSNPCKKLCNEEKREEQFSSSFTKNCDAGAVVKKCSLPGDSFDESLDECNEPSSERESYTNDYEESWDEFDHSDEMLDVSGNVTDDNSDILSNFSIDKNNFDSEQESSPDDCVENWDEYDNIADDDIEMQKYSTTDSELDYDSDFHDIKQDWDQGIDSCGKEAVSSNHPNNILPNKNIHESHDDENLKKDADNEDGIYNNNCAIENPSLYEENNKELHLKQAESLPTPPKRMKLDHATSSQCLGGVRSLSKKKFKNVHRKHATIDEVKKYFIQVNKKRSRIKKRTYMLADFETNGQGPHETTISESIDSMLIGADKLESQINYKFKNRSLLLQALTHASYYSNRITECYQRLEFLGDAVLDFIITCHIYETGGNLNPGQLTDLRSALVNNITFASLVVRYGLHRHLLHLSPSLMEAIDSFVEFQLQRDNAVTEDCLVLMEEDECYLAESVEVPKALGDILESLAGAIFLDSGLSLTAVWQVFYPMMKNEIQAFMKKVPKQPVRELLETNANIQFMPSEEVKPSVIGDEVQRSGLNKQIVMVPVKVTEEGSGQERIFYGFGERKALAKRAAAKLALRAMGKGTKPQYSEKDC